VANGHVVPIDRAGVVVARFVWRQMGNDLVAIKIEVNPLVAGTTFWAT
jgi:hypothetical protein